MKTYVYVSFNGPRGGRRVETGTKVPDNYDCVASLGREPTDNELIGTGCNQKEALQDALQHSSYEYVVTNHLLF